jgi:acyl carrier protein
MVFEKVRKILADYKEIDESAIELTSTLEDLEFDSLDTVEVMMSIEEEFDVQLEADENIKTVEDLVKLIEANIQ